MYYEPFFPAETGAMQCSIAQNNICSFYSLTQTSSRYMGLSFLSQPWMCRPCFADRPPSFVHSRVLIDCQITCLLPTMAVDRIIILTKKWQAFLQPRGRQLHTPSCWMQRLPITAVNPSYTLSTTKVNFLILRALALLRQLWWGLHGRRLCVVMCKGLGVERVHHPLL